MNIIQKTVFTYLFLIFEIKISEPFPNYLIIFGGKNGKYTFLENRRKFCNCRKY